MLFEKPERRKSASAFECRIYLSALRRKVCSKGTRQLKVGWVPFLSVERRPIYSVICLYEVVFLFSTFINIILSERFYLWYCFVNTDLWTALTNES